jgi:hypothetical protein
VLKKRKVEAHGDFILGPVSPKEYKDTVAELNGSRTNRVFEFFKVVAPERVGFAKHREAAERKAVALGAVNADAGETATSPRAAPTKRAGRKNIPAAATTAATEGRARKKCGGRPADSPPAAKRTQVDPNGQALGQTFGQGRRGSRRATARAAEPDGERQRRRQ